MKVKFFERFDYFLILCITILCAFGVLFIYSSGIDSDGVLKSREYLKQIIWFSLGFVVMIIVALVDYRHFKRYSKWGYLLLLAMLLFTLLNGTIVNNARSWIGVGSLGIQPSELGKVLFILFLASYMDKSSKVPPLRRFITALLIMAVPMLLILRQPDLGTACVYLPICLFMCYMTDIPFRYIAYILLLGFTTIILTVLPVWHTKIWLSASSHQAIAVISILTNMKLRFTVIAILALIAFLSLLGYLTFKKVYYYWLTYTFSVLSLSFLLSIAAGKVLHEYQIQRLIIFIDPYTDRLKTGWNIIQSITAIGAGKFTGRGYLGGIQSHLRYLPEQSTDFIFSILAEEAGFIGGTLVFSLFLVIFIKIIKIIKTTTNTYGYFIASGILGMMFFHFSINVGMVMGIMPVTGIPLPFLSYGGSSLLTNMISIGLLMSINSRRLEFETNII